MEPPSGPEREADAAPVELGRTIRRSVGEPQSTAHAGLFLLLPLMARLGIAGLLEEQPQLIELDLPNRLLRDAGRRLRIPADDAAFSILEEPGGPPLAGLELILPAAWRGLALPGRWVIRHQPGTDGARGLFDRSGRLALALWRGRPPPAVRELARRRALRRGPSLPPGSSADVLLEAWFTAMRRWCRRYAGLELADLIRRPGRIMATRTHLDVFFSLRQVDIRVRRAGLDIDPGWAPWFGRVVQFHYVEGE
jgi:hypothetical protein